MYFQRREWKRGKKKNETDKKERETKWQWDHVIPAEEGSERNYRRLNGFPDALKEPGMEMKSKWSDASVETQGPAPLIWRTRVTCATPLRLMAYLCGGAQSNPNFDVQEAEEGGCGIQEAGTSMTVHVCVSGLRENLWAWELSWFIQNYAWSDWSVSLDKRLCITIKRCSGSIFIVRALKINSLDDIIKR